MMENAITSRKSAFTMRTKLLAGSVAVALGWPFAAIAQDGIQGAVASLPTGQNTEKGRGAADPGAKGFSISYDGEAPTQEAPVDVQRVTDIDLSAADIQVKFDGLGGKPILNVSTADLRASYQAGDPVTFRASSNYPAWISRSEIRIFDASDFGAARPDTIIALETPNQSADWTMPSDGEGDYRYVLRVYDAEGRFDETKPLNLRRTSAAFETHQTTPEGDDVVAAGEGDDRTGVRNIPVYGGAITVFGRDIPAGFKVRAIGEPVPLDGEGSFVIQRILPPGEHFVDVDVAGEKSQEISFSREVVIPKNEWFYIGLADFTFGRRIQNSLVNEGQNGSDNRTYSRGRLAFYAKGKIKGEYILTAAADTTEQELRSLFSNLDEKDPRSFLRRIDPDKFYPVYGDDSKTVEDAPTNGKFFIKLQRHDSHVMWGNYKTKIKASTITRNERALYGAQGVYRSRSVTDSGDRRAEAEVYAAQPGTLPQRDNLRGTGGSVYFLSRQDLNKGSETISIERRDAITGVVLSREQLRYGEDYEINYTQGVIILKNPLSSNAGSDTIVTSGSLGGDEQFLVAQYEYTPGIGQVKGYSYGGRAQLWVTDRVRVGVTAMNEETGTADQQLAGGDVRIKLGDNSYISGEIIRSQGPGFGSTSSANGGLTINTDLTAGQVNKSAMAYRADLQIDLADFHPQMKGLLTAYYQHLDAGFSSLTTNASVRQQSFGAKAKFEVFDHTRVKLAYEDFQDGNGQLKREGDFEIERDLDAFWSIGLGTKYSQLNGASTNSNVGRRWDVGARLTYKLSEDEKIFIFGQTTLTRTGNLRRNDRIGVGFEKQLTEKLGFIGQVSSGSLGWGGEAKLTYSPTADKKYHIGYKLDPERQYSSSTALNGIDQGVIVMGANHKVNDALSLYTETSYDMFGERLSLANNYGVKYTPDAKWTFDGLVNYGSVQDVNDNDIDRVALSLSVAYKDEEAISWKIKGETRFDNSADPNLDRETYLFKASTTIKYSDDWRFLGNIDAAISNSDQTSVRDGDFIEGSIGFAYRPADNDKFNGLFKYAYLYDFPGPDQVNASGSTLGPAQRSHILTADGSYDVTERLTLGAKYGFRIGEVSEDRTESNFSKSSAHLGILRADYHIVKKWDVFAEARILHTPEIDTTLHGFVVGAYRHVGNNLKVGVGYNFGEFSDNVSDLTLNDEGIFLNVVGKF